MISDYRDSDTGIISHNLKDCIIAYYLVRTYHDLAGLGGTYGLAPWLSESATVPQCQESETLRYTAELLVSLSISCVTNIYVRIYRRHYRLSLSASLHII